MFIPHLNVRGIVESASGDNLWIVLSDKSNEFLNTRKINIYTPNSKTKLNTNDIVFIKFKHISIKGNRLKFVSLEVYKYYETIKKEVIGLVTWWVPNDFGGLLKTSGTEFIFNGNKYVDYDDDISEDGKQYFVDIYDGQLLFEEYKNIFPPMKWYNMVNPQETYFDIIVDIYKNKR